MIISQFSLIIVNFFNCFFDLSVSSMLLFLLIVLQFNRSWMSSAAILSNHATCRNQFHFYWNAQWQTILICDCLHVSKLLANFFVNSFLQCFPLPLTNATFFMSLDLAQRCGHLPKFISKLDFPIYVVHRLWLKILVRAWNFLVSNSPSSSRNS